VLIALVESIAAGLPGTGQVPGRPVAALGR